jgi:hypothetical protein
MLVWLTSTGVTSIHHIFLCDIVAFVPFLFEIEIKTNDEEKLGRGTRLIHPHHQSQGTLANISL